MKIKMPVVAAALPHPGHKVLSMIDTLLSAGEMHEPPFTMAISLHLLSGPFTCHLGSLMRISHFVIVFSIISGLAFAQAPDSPSASTPRQDSPSQNISSTNADMSWRPTLAQRQQIESLTLAYFSAKDANRHDEAYRYLDPRQQQHLPKNVFIRTTEELNQTAGKVIATALRAVTWYKDTPQAGPGLYVAVDYTRSRENLALNCGYVIWHEQSDNSFLVLRDETNVIDKQTMEKISPSVFQDVQKQFKCK